MINQTTGQRELAYIAKVDETKELPNYTNVHYIRVLGWWCVSSKEINVNDEVVFFEPDSVLPKDDVRFEFLSGKKYRIKVQNICRVVSQGLVMRKSDFPELSKCSVGDFVTDILKVTHYEDIESDKPSNVKQKSDWHIPKNKFIAYMFRFELFRKLYRKFGSKNKSVWPKFVSKTDQERIANVPHLLDDKETRWVATEKVDGCSTTYALEKSLFGKKYYVCSRNIVLSKSDKSKYTSTNVWWNNYEKYNIKSKLDYILEKYKVHNVSIQGESYGNGIQKRTYSLSDQDFVVFHIWIDGSKLPMIETIKLSEELGLPHVYIFYEDKVLPDTVKELEDFVEQHKSHIDNGDLEGMVFYDDTSNTSFKCVSPKYLMKYHNG